jgi:hypothetical protein
MPARRALANAKRVVLKALPAPQKISADKLARMSSSSQDVSVVPVRVLSRRLRQEFERSAAKQGSALSSLNAPAMDEVSTICARVLASLTEDSVGPTAIVDPVSGLRLPPPVPMLLYKDRKSVAALRKTTPEQFINIVSPWAEYRQARILAVDFILTHDESLYTALGNRARYAGRTIVELLKEIGIYSRPELLNPSAENLRTVKLIRAALALDVGTEKQ